MRMLVKCHNNSSDNPLTSRRTDGGNNYMKNCYSSEYPLSSRRTDGGKYSNFLDDTNLVELSICTKDSSL